MVAYVLLSRAFPRYKILIMYWIKWWALLILSYNYLCVPNFTIILEKNI